MHASTSAPFGIAAELSEEIVARRGVVTLFGYGTNVRVERGHLVIEEGIGLQRRRARFARVGHGLKRLVVIGCDGLVSFSALRWLSDQNAAFVVVDRDGSVISATGAGGSSDPGLRRAQALADVTGSAVQITKELIAQKLLGQERVTRDKLQNYAAAEKIADFRNRVDSASTIIQIRQFEALAAKAYWHAWRSVAINFPRVDVGRVPAHWKLFGNRVSPLTNSPRLAVNPPNAILNYLYAMLELEARLAATALGLDPGLGVLHVDTKTRDSLACDLMEPVRPVVDAYLLDWLSRGQLRRDWFFEQRDGNCRLMAALAKQLSETAATWRNALGPHAERAGQILWSTITRPSEKLATPLTQRHRRAAKGVHSELSVPAPRAIPICKLCGKAIRRGTTSCASCSPTISREALMGAAQKGRIAAQTPQVLSRLGAKQRIHQTAIRNWNRADQPEWLNETYTEKISPRLADVTISTMALTLGVSLPYASDIRAGRRIPHRRHWPTLSKLLDSV